jgi:tetratricopeptide (TPR) repeat protein
MALSKLDRSIEAEKALNELNAMMHNQPQSYLELAIDYANAGSLDDAIDVLERLVNNSEDKNRIYPMVYYHLGYYCQRQGNSTKAAGYYRLAGQMPPDYCFPYQLESVDILKAALRQNPRDARAAYYLGNLLNDIQPENAIASWQESIKLDGSFAIAHRNLGLALAQNRNGLQAGIASLERAVQCNSQEARYLTELDTLYEIAAVPHQKRLSVLEQHQETVFKRDDTLIREVGLKVLTGEYNQAIALLGNRHFHLWEGGDDELSNVHELYVDAHLLRGQSLMRAKKYEEALKDFQLALEYPERFEMGKPFRGGGGSQVYYQIGLAYEALANSAKAKESFQKALEMKLGRADFRQPLRYYQGLAYAKLGQETKSVQIFDDLIRNGQQRLKAQSTDFFAKFGGAHLESAQKAQAHYLIGLGYLGKGLTTQARQELEKAHQLDINNLGVQTQLASLSGQK